MSGVVGVRSVERLRTAVAGKSRAVGRFQINQPTNVATPEVALLGLSGFLSLQDDAAPERRDRRARRDGEQVLAALQSIQLGLLDESGPGLEAQFCRLDRALGEMNAPADPTLAAILAQIRLRGQVELARRRCVRAALLEKS